MLVQLRTGLNRACPSEALKIERCPYTKYTIHVFSFYNKNDISSLSSYTPANLANKVIYIALHNYHHYYTNLYIILHQLLLEQ